MNQRQAEASKKARIEAYTDGIRDGIRGTYTGVYGAILLACEKMGYDSETAMELLRNVDEVCCNYVATEDIAGEVLKKYGIRMTFDDGFGHFDR